MKFQIRKRSKFVSIITFRNLKISPRSNYCGAPLWVVLEDAIDCRRPRAIRWGKQRKVLQLHLLFFRGLGGGFGKCSYVRRCRPAFLRFSKSAFFVGFWTRSVSAIVSKRCSVKFCAKCAIARHRSFWYSAERVETSSAYLKMGQYNMKK